MANNRMSLKLLVDTKAHKVLFAKAGKDFVDFLFDLLTLPVGTVMRLLNQQEMAGCLSKLYDSFQNLDESYVQPGQKKGALLKPKIISDASHVPLLFPTDASTSQTIYYRCSSSSKRSSQTIYSKRSRCSKGYPSSKRSSSYCSGSHYTDDEHSTCPDCRKKMSTKLTFVAGPEANMVQGDGGGFVKGVVTYMVMDDLVVVPMSVISSITMLNKLNVKEVGDLEERVVEVGVNEGLKLLKSSMESKTVLTCVFLGERGIKPIMGV